MSQRLGSFERASASKPQAIHAVSGVDLFIGSSHPKMDDAIRGVGSRPARRTQTRQPRGAGDQVAPDALTDLDAVQSSWTT
jgi:hypothetical protein